MMVKGAGVGLAWLEPVADMMAVEGMVKGVEVEVALVERRVVAKGEGVTEVALAAREESMVMGTLS